jgi:hypothetical protein
MQASEVQALSTEFVAGSRLFPDAARAIPES